MNALATEATQQDVRAQLIPAPNTTMGFSNASSFELMQRAAKLLASSTLVPKEYQSNLPNCVIALNMAQRVGADPLQVMQNLYVVHGRPGWSSQFLIATFNQCGRFNAMKFEFFGEQGKDSWGCRAYSTEKETGERIVSSDITLKLAKDEGWYGKQGSKWKTMPQQMMMYRAAAFLVRVYAPELSMGLQTQEELRDVGEVPTATVTLAGREPATLAQLEAELTGSAPPADSATDAPAVTAEGIRLALENATTRDELDDAASSVSLLPEDQRQALLEFWNERCQQVVQD